MNTNEVKRLFAEIAETATAEAMSELQRATRYVEVSMGEARERLEEAEGSVDDLLSVISSELEGAVTNSVDNALVEILEMMEDPVNTEGVIEAVFETMDIAEGRHFGEVDYIHIMKAIAMEATTRMAAFAMAKTNPWEKV